MYSTEKIRKLEIASGINWIEVPAVNLRVLCGCPADCVKHLMKRGLIANTESGGKTFQTGPNAILLSDVGLQNGQFSNLSEFPVLQMLYNQGMIIPGHPGNSGHKPLLIGHADQVFAQLEYIFRGNYGLSSVSEMKKAGMSNKEAAEMMDIKLKFAFGSIRGSRELVDTRILEDSPIDIKQGVMVRRRDINIFEFSFENEKKLVDLNLPAAATYDAPYPLGFHNLPREYFAVVHSGNGDGWDVNRPSMASILMFQGRIYLIDCGPNINSGLQALGIGIHEIEGVFHTHCHDDHFAGLTSLVRSDRRIKYYATKPVQMSVAKKLAALMTIPEKDFGHYFDVDILKCDAWNNIDGLQVKPVFSPHPVETSVLFFRAMGVDGYRTYAHLADIASRSVLKSMLKKTKSGPGMTKERLNHVVKNYMTPVDIKKLDIGGGMIHGNAEDFRTDKSKKIILAHTAKPLTESQKEIGSGATFGAMDVLIPSYQDYLRRYAANFLFNYLSDVPDHLVRMLLNQPVETFNPETIMLREGEKVDKIYLLLAGTAEMLDSTSDFQGMVSAGAMIGELDVLLKKIPTETYRTTSFVTTLTIQSGLYQSMVEKLGIVKKISKYAALQDFLLRSWLFGENLSPELQTEIAASMKLEKWGKGLKFRGIKKNTLYIVKKGRVETVFAGKAVEFLHSGNFFGEDTVLFGSKPNKRLKVLSNSEIYTVPGSVISEIPVVRWKLMETYQRRLQFDPTETA